jgi:hypothetical protein
MEKRATKTSKNFVDTLEYEMGVITAAMSDLHKLEEIVKRLGERSRGRGENGSPLPVR